VSPSARAHRWRSVSVLAAAALMLAGISATLVTRVTWQDQTSAAHQGTDAGISRLANSDRPADGGRIDQPDRSAELAPRLILQQNESYATDDTIPLGLQISGDAANLAVEITGLPPGTTLSVGRAMGQGGWRVLGANVGNAMIHPPPAFHGALEFAAELRLADDTVVDHGSFRLEWTPVIAPAAVAFAGEAIVRSSPTEPNAIQQTAEPRLTREQVELLIGRSQKLMTEGDFPAARTLLQRAAEARDARAALALGATFDPIMLAILQARGIVPDVSLARYWYQKARELGSDEAEQRLKLLAPARPDQVSQIAVGRVKVSRFVPGRTNTVSVD
jgi:hypothetical protein